MKVNLDVARPCFSSNPTLETLEGRIEELGLTCHWAVGHFTCA